MTAWSVDKAIEGIARRQHGAFSDRQARRCGATTRIIRRRLATGRWIEFDHHVYVLPSHPGSWLRQCMAATLASHGGVIGFASAAALHRLEGFNRGSIHVVARLGSKHTSRIAAVHRSNWPQRTAIDSVPVVTLPDTFFQLAGTAADPRRVRRAFADAVVEREWLLAAMLDRYVDLAHSRLAGISLVHDLLEAHHDGEVPTTTELERMLDDVLDAVPGMPARRRQAPRPGWEHSDARVDTLVPDWRLIVEADGRRWHTRVDDFERDRWRDNVATTQGYDVLRFTYSQLSHDHSGVLALLARYAERHLEVA